MKLDYVFKKYDYVVCKDLTEEQIQSLVDRMVECGAKRYKEIVDFDKVFNTLAWDEKGETCLQEESFYSRFKHYTEVKWEYIVKESKPESSTKTLREMFPNGMYTDNSEEVFERFKELLENDYDVDDDSEYYGSSLHCGLDGEFSNMLSQYESCVYGSNPTYLTNEELFAIKLEPNDEQGISIEDITQVEIQAGNLDDELGFDLIVDSEEPDTSIGYLIEQIQLNTSPNSPEVIIGKDGSVVLYGLDLEINVSGKSADEIDKIYQALSTLMDA